MKSIVIASVLLIAASPAYASSDDAWAEFAQEVEQGCVTATAGTIKEPSVVVDPFGSETYGMALVTGEVADGVTKSIICVFDKQTKAVEVGGELDVPVPAAGQ